MRFLIFIFFVFFWTDVPATAQLKTASVAGIFETYNTCFAATLKSEIDLKAIEKLGWAKATTTSDGKETDLNGLIIYGHSEYKPIIIVNNKDKQGICIVTAKLDDFDVFNQFISAFGDTLPKADKDGTIAFSSKGRVVQIARTGSKKEPAMRIIILKLKG